MFRTNSNYLVADNVKGDRKGEGKWSDKSL